MKSIIFTFLILTSALYANARIYLVETNEIIAFKENGLYHFKGKVDRLTYNPEKNQDYLMFTMVDQPRSFDKPFLINKTDTITINLITSSIGKTKVYFKSEQTPNGLLIKAIQLIDKDFDH